MNKLLLALSLLLMVSCASAMETEVSEDKKEEPEKVSIFDEMKKGITIDPALLPKFYEDFQKHLADGTLDPNETFRETGFPASDVLLEMRVFMEFSPKKLGFENPSNMSLKLYNLLAPKMDSNQKNSYRVDARIPGNEFYKCVMVEAACSEHSRFIETIDVDEELDDYRFHEITHEQVLEILMCGLAKVDGARLNFKQEEAEKLRSEYINRLEELVEKYKKVKEEETLKMTMLCLQEKGCSIPARDAIASMIKTGRSDAFKEDKNGNEN